MAKKYFYGIYGIQYINHGAWADPELVWHGKSFNYYDVENPLWFAYKEECEEKDKRPDVLGNEFDVWVKKNAHMAREFLQNLMENKCFYGA